MKKEQMIVINEFFEECINDTKQMIRNDIEEYTELFEATKVEVEYDGGSYEVWIPNYSDFTKTAINLRGTYLKQTYVYGRYEAKPEFINNQLTIDCINKWDAYVAKQVEIIERYPAAFLEVAKTYRVNEDKMDQVVRKYFTKKKEALIANLQKKGGEVYDAIKLSFNMGILNGLFKCKNGNVKIETIFAGGYNIQCLHIRTLVKLLKK